MPLTLQQINAATVQEACTLLDGVYPPEAAWAVTRALAQRPFVSLAQLKFALANAVTVAERAAQLALLRAQAGLGGLLELNAASPAEPANQSARRLRDSCNADDLAKLTRLHAEYVQRFEFPMALALQGPRGTGLGRHDVLCLMERRLQNHADDEVAECLHHMHRVAELRLNDLFAQPPLKGQLVWDWHEDLARWSEPEAKAKGQLTVTYLTPAHRSCAQSLSLTFRNCGFDDVHVDAVGNVVGRYHGQHREAPALLTGSHYDTVRNGGKYDGRLGIFVPAACVHELAQTGRRLPFAIELVAFAEEEGQRYNATFLGSSALTGHFSYGWLAQRDTDRISMSDAMEHAGLSVQDIAAIRRDPAKYLGFVEVHIEQGPVLQALGLALGVVSSINGSVRYRASIEGLACHAGTTPMNRRRDAAMAAAELMMYLERRAAQSDHLVGTVGVLQIPHGSVNVVPGRCEFSLDLRAPTDPQRDELAGDVLRELAAICERRGLRHQVEQASRASAAPSAPAWQHRWERAVAAQGLPVHRMPSGAGHDAMKMHAIMPQAMLFVRGQNGGISHNPLESVTADDMQLAVQAFAHLLEQLAQTP